VTSRLGDVMISSAIRKSDAVTCASLFQASLLSDMSRAATGFIADSIAAFVSGALPVF
jgi:hypothetical protein